jgi:transposase-like protein
LNRHAILVVLERFAAQVVHWHHAPMNAYSEDLRKKIVQALRRGTTKSEAARSFGVSRSSVKRYAKLAQEGRPLAPKSEEASWFQAEDGPERQEAFGSGHGRTPRGYPLRAV